MSINFSIAKNWGDAKFETSNVDAGQWELDESLGKMINAFGHARRHYPDGEVVVRLQPSKCVMAKRNYKSGQLFLTPRTTNGHHVDIEEPQKMCVQVGKSLIELIQPSKHAPPAWSMRSTDIKKDANMRLMHIKVHTKNSIGGAKKDAKDAKDATSMITIPVFVNTTNVFEGMELVKVKEASTSSSSTSDAKGGLKRSFDLV